LYGKEFKTSEEENAFWIAGVGISGDCAGDSGGPSFYKGVLPALVQYGLVARGGDGLCTMLFRSPYGLHTKISAHVSYFIDRMIRKYR